MSLRPVSIHDYPSDWPSPIVRFSYTHADMIGAVECLGVPHTFCFSDPSHEVIRHAILSSAPDIVLVEGLPQQLSVADFILAICEVELPIAVSRFGETATAVSAALAVGALADCPEPSLRHQVDYLRRLELSDEAIFLYYMLRKYPSFRRRMAALSTLYDLAIKNFENLLGYAGPQKRLCGGCSFELLNELCQEYFGKSVDSVNEDLVTELINPVAIVSSGVACGINSVAKRLTEFRDNWIVAETIAHARQGKRVTVVYGSGHVLMQRRLLMEFFSRQNGSFNWAYDAQTNTFGESL